MRKQTTTQLLAELKTLAGAARDNIFRRIQIVRQILDDHAWVARVYDGDEIKARDSLQHEYFHELNGAYTLGTLLSIHAMFADVKVWEQNRYNLQTMRALYEEQKVPDKPGIKQKRVSAKDLEEAEEKLQEATQYVRRAEELLKEREREIETLQSKVAALSEENALLRGRIYELEKATQRFVGV